MFVECRKSLGGLIAYLSPFYQMEEAQAVDSAGLENPTLSSPVAQACVLPGMFSRERAGYGASWTKGRQRKNSSGSVRCCPVLKPPSRCGANGATGRVSVRECSWAPWSQVTFEADVGAGKDLACVVTHINSNVSCVSIWMTSLDTL